MTKKKIELKPYDGTEFLDNEEVREAYLNAELEEGDPHYIKIALQAIARSRKMTMTEIAKKAGVPRATVYRALSVNGNPEFITMQKIVAALDMQFMAVSTSKDYSVVRESSD